MCVCGVWDRFGGLSAGGAGDRRPDGSLDHDGRDVCDPVHVPVVRERYGLLELTLRDVHGGPNAANRARGTTPTLLYQGASGRARFFVSCGAVWSKND